MFRKSKLAKKLKNLESLNSKFCDFLSLICAALKELPPKLSEDVARYLYELHVRDVKWVPLALQPENFKLKIKLPALKKVDFADRFLGAGASPAHESLKIL